MIKINCPNGRILEITEFGMKTDARTIWSHLEHQGLTENSFYMTYNGRLIHNESDLVVGYVTITPKLFGGKGGFGSMLRAIGAQIEKTTNREACRDLSGRRLRDINEEKRLKTWIEKQSLQEKDTSKRKRKKLEPLYNDPVYKFEDKEYESERSVLSEKIDDAVKEGMKCNNLSLKQDKSQKKKGKKRKTILDDDDYDDTSSNDSRSSNDEVDTLNSDKKTLVDSTLGKSSQIS